MRDYRHGTVKLEDGKITVICSVPQDSSQVLVRNTGASVAYIGGDDVDAESGFPVFPDDAPIPVPCFDSDTATLYGVAADGVSTSISFIVSS
jgi:hypothetical protein